MRWLAALLAALVLVAGSVPLDAPKAQGMEAVPSGTAPSVSPMTMRYRDYKVCRLEQLMEVIGHGTYILSANERIPANVTVVNKTIDANGCVVVTLYDRSFDLAPIEQRPLFTFEWQGNAPYSIAWNRVDNCLRRFPRQPEMCTNAASWGQPVAPLPVIVPGGR